MTLFRVLPLAFVLIGCTNDTDEDSRASGGADAQAMTSAHRWADPQIWRVPLPLTKENYQTLAIATPPSHIHRPSDPTPDPFPPYLVSDDRL